MRRFFELPEDVKAKFAANKQVVESACYSHVASLKEYFQVRASGSGIDGIAFPSKEFAEAVLQVYGDFDEIGRKVFPLLLARTDVPQSDISKMIDPRPESSMGKIIVEYSDSSTTSNLVPTNYISSSNVDLFHYYNDPSTEAKWPMNHSSHTDSGILSFIPCSDEPGLDFYDQKLNCWLAIEDLIHRSAPGKYQEYGIVMVSDSIEQISKKQIAAGLHRVSRGVRPRDSIVFKMRGRPACTLHLPDSIFTSIRVTE